MQSAVCNKQAPIIALLGVSSGKQVMNAPHSTPTRLVPLTTLDQGLQMKIRDLRNEDEVRRWMYSDHIITEVEHLRWIENLRHDSRQLVFAVMEDGSTPLRVVSLNAIDRLHGKADWAYYLASSARGGLGSAIEFAFVDFFFNTLGFDKLNCEVIEGNSTVVKLHKKFQFQEEGFRRSNIVKHGVRLGVHFLGLTKSDWQEGRSEIYGKYKAVFKRHRVVIDAGESAEKRQRVTTDNKDTEAKR